MRDLLLSLLFSLIINLSVQSMDADTDEQTNSKLAKLSLEDFKISKKTIIQRKNFEGHIDVQVELLERIKKDAVAQREHPDIYLKRFNEFSLETSQLFSDLCKKQEEYENMSSLIVEINSLLTMKKDIENMNLLKIRIIENIEAIRRFEEGIKRSLPKDYDDPIYPHEVLKINVEKYLNDRTLESLVESKASLTFNLILVQALAPLFHLPQMLDAE